MEQEEKFLITEIWGENSSDNGNGRQRKILAIFTFTSSSCSGCLNDNPFPRQHSGRTINSTMNRGNISELR